MKAMFRISAPLLARMRADLERPHAYACERVGFITAGCAWVAQGDLLLVARSYRPVDDCDYTESDAVGAEINSAALRKGLQSAYRPAAALFHVHTHGGSGTPRLSRVDLRSAHAFVPSFFNFIPQMPHGIIVLSDDTACGLVWLGPEGAPSRLDRLVSVGTRVKRIGGRS